MTKPTDKSLYESVKRRIYKKVPKHSAYRSGLLVKAYKEAYKKKHKKSNAYSGVKKKNKGLSRWFKEEWRTQDNKKTYKKKSDVFRPTKKITKKTPTTYKELGGMKSKRVKKAQKEKLLKGRVKKY